MGLRWTTSAQRDLVRLHSFLAPVDAAAAARAVQLILSGVREIARLPGLGSRLTEFAPREVRRLIRGHDELRYEVRPDELVILRVWQVLEDR